MQLQCAPSIADRPSFTGRPSRLSLVGADGLYPSLFDLLLVQAVELGIVDSTPVRGRVQIASLTDPATKRPYPIFANESIFVAEHWRMTCTERSVGKRVGMTFVLLERRGKTFVHLLRATSPGISETGVDLKRWVFGRTRYFSDSHFMKRVCGQIGASWLLDMDTQVTSRLFGKDLSCQHSDFALDLLSAIVEIMATALN
jgi:hypothetical protein